MILHGVVAYLAGLWFGPFLSFFPLSLLGTLLSVSLLLTWFEQRGSLSRWGGVLIFTLIIAGMGQAHWATMSQRQTPLALPIAGTIPHSSGRYRGAGPLTPDSVIMLVDVKHVLTEGRSRPMNGRLRLTWRDPDTSVRYGHQVNVTARIREPYGTLNPRGFHYGEYLQQKGIQAVATVSGPQAVQVLTHEGSWRWVHLVGMVDEWRQSIYHSATASLSNPALGLFLGMIIGEQSHIEQDLRDAFMASGTVHILSISGSHLGLLALIIFTVTRWSVRRLPSAWLERLSIYLTATQCSVIMTLPIVSFYMLLAGAEMATVRSWIMIVVCCLGIWLGRERNLVTALAVAALLMVVPYPQAIHDISFQLSYLSVAAIGLVLITRTISASNTLDLPEVAPRETKNWIERWWKSGQLAWLMTIAVSLTTLPLVAYYFHQIPWLGVVTNLVIVPLVGIVVIPLGLLSAVGVLLTGTEALPFASGLQAIFEVFAKMIIALSQIPGAEWYVASPHVVSMVVFWCLLAGTVWCRPWPMARWGSFALLIGILGWWAWSPRTHWEPGTVRVTFFDVGQGDATFLELPDGQTVLIDGGPAYRRLDMGRAVIGPYLWNQGIHRIDHVVATHPQWDHVGGCRGF